MLPLPGLLLLVALTTVTATTYDIVQPTEWWQTATVYQIWPRSFKDSDGNGIGDLNGITSKLHELAELGIDAIWICPFYDSPIEDSGYDVADYYNVAAIYGTLEDFTALIARAEELGLKVLLDFVPNHTSDQHEWFTKSKASIEPYTDYYVWNEGILDANGTRQPPNNWLSHFNGSAWEWVDERQAYYLRQFWVEQPDLNLTNPLVIQETKDILSYWMDLGVHGFRMDALNYMIEYSLEDEPLSGTAGYPESTYGSLSHVYTRDRLENYPLMQEWRDHIDNYTATKNDGVVRMMCTEMYANVSRIMKSYESGAQVPFNFYFIKGDNFQTTINLASASDVENVVYKWMDNMPANATANWVLGNHDNYRVATRYGIARVDIMNLLLFLLPGVATIYNGDELGMTNTLNPRTCSTDGSANCVTDFRDGQRTPYQWDNTTSAGFSTNATTEMRVNENYLTVNLAAQKEADVSHYKNVQAALKLRKSKVLQQGSLTTEVIDDQVFAFSREYDGEKPIVVLLNWANTTVTISLEVFVNVSDTLEVVIADINSGISAGDVYEKTSVELPGYAGVVLIGTDETR